MTAPKPSRENGAPAAAGIPPDLTAPASPHEELSDAELASVSGGLRPPSPPSGPVPIPYPNTSK